MLTIHTAAEDLRHGRLSPVDLVKSCLERIERFDERVRAWVLVDREGALSRAEECAAEIKRGQWRGPLHGIPLAIKDIFDVFDWPTAAGSRLWKNSIARQDATVVRRLRQAGAIFVGKTVTTQFASFDPPPTRNPWNAARTPGGSSSGSAAALACGMCLGALGSQTGGSIARPASYCGVAGCKPTFGRISTDGVVPLAPSMDHPGPLARCVRDLEILLLTIADAGWPVEYARITDTPTLTPTLGRLGGLFDSKADASVLAMMEEVTDKLARARRERRGRELAGLVRGGAAAPSHDHGRRGGGVSSGAAAPSSRRLRSVDSLAARRRASLSRAGVRPLQGASGIAAPRDGGLF